MGNPYEMNALRHELAVDASLLLKNNNSKDAKDETPAETVVMIHCATANDGQTSDGIVAGGTRLAEEINNLVEQTQRHFFGVADARQEATGNDNSNASRPLPSPRITLSLVGNSLGGLYARYALSKITGLQHQPQLQDSDGNEDAPVVHAKVFATTASPHLGIGYGHTYLPIPRLLEQSIARVLQQTGVDLFQTADSGIIADLTFDQTFVAPLLAFQHRLAYANAYGTDFQVPTATAAFLDPARGDATHRVVAAKAAGPDRLAGQNDPNSGEDDKVVLVVETAAAAATASLAHNKYRSSSPGAVTTAELAQALDDMGWTKVFCDVRRDLPSISLWPFVGRGSTTESAKDHALAATATVGANLSSADLYRHFATFGSSRESDGRLYFPGGHTVLVANAKNEWYARLNAAGKPAMARLARDLLAVILKTEEDVKDNRPPS
jgi:hypothetical protein